MSEGVGSDYRGRFAAAGFALVELWVVLTVVAVLSCVLLPALSDSRLDSKSFQCMENTRRLTLAWQMYAQENNDNLVLASDDGSGNPYQTTLPSNRNQLNLCAWTWSKMNFSMNNAFNYDPNADIKLRPLWSYVKDTSIYKCPADGSQALSNGVAFPRIRSYSMNYFLGGAAGVNTLAGAWTKYFPPYMKLSELGSLAKSPGPARTFVFLDERWDWINWGNFATDMGGYPIGTANANPALYQWYQNLAASYHNLGVSMSFADGHVEIHRWHETNTCPPLVVGKQFNGGNSSHVLPAPYSQDVAWMQSVAARPH